MTALFYFLTALCVAYKHNKKSLNFIVENTPTPLALPKVNDVSFFQI